MHFLIHHAGYVLAKNMQTQNLFDTSGIYIYPTY